MNVDARRLGLFLACGGFMVVLDTTVAIVAVPKLLAQFGTSLAVVGWITTGYVLALVAVMPTAAWAIARLGGRRTYLLAVTMFTFGSLLCGLSWGIGSLIAFRVVQGLGGGLLNPVGMAIALGAVPPERRGRMMSLLGLPILIAPVLGPVLGGLLVDHASWRWIFFLNLPVGIAIVLIGRRVLPSVPRQPAARLDRLGLLLLSPGLTLAVLGCTIAGDRGELLTPAVLVPLVTGVAMVTAFAFHARRAKAPLLKLEVLRHRSMAAGAATLALFAAAYFGSLVINPVYVQTVRGDSATLAGLVGIPAALATGISLQVATRLVDRVQPRIVVGVGVAIAVLGVVTMALVLRTDLPYPVFMAVNAVTGIGVGATLMPTMTAASRPLTGPDLPSGTTLLPIVSQSSVAIGTALIAAVLSWLFIRYPDDGAHALRLTLIVPATLMVLAWLVSRRLPAESRVRPAPPAGPAPASDPTVAPVPVR